MRYTKQRVSLCLNLLSGSLKKKISSSVSKRVASVVMLLFLPACVVIQPRETSLEKEIAEANKKIDEIYHRISVIQFMVDDHERIVRGGLDTKKKEDNQKETGAESIPLSLEKDWITIEEAQIVSPSDTPPEIPESVETLYKRALTSYKAGNYKEALPIFKSVVANNPNHNFADNALYWTGECLYAQKKFSKAITAFKKIIEKYPNGGKVSDALLKTGYAYLSLGDREDGRIYLKKVISNYPLSLAGSKAEEMLKRIK